MSVKAPRGLTHARKLLEPEAWIGRIAAGWHELGDRRAVLLVQLGSGQARDDDLAWWADRIREWERQGTEVFAYFNNDGGANAVRNARTLRAMLGQ